MSERKIRVRPGATVAAWLFGYVPADIRDDIAAKHPDLYLVGFRRGPAIRDLRREDPRDHFVAIPELWGWGILRELPPRRARRLFEPSLVGPALLLAALPAQAQDPGALRALMVEREARHEARVLDALTARAGAAGMVVEVTPADAGVAEVAETPAPLPSRLSMAAWCAVSEGEDDDVARCEMGPAIALRRWRVERDPGRSRALTAFVGSETAGAGFAWLTELDGGAVVGAGLGVSVVWGSEGGVDPETVRIVVGGNIGFGGRGDGG